MAGQRKRRRRRRNGQRSPERGDRGGLAEPPVHGGEPPPLVAPVRDLPPALRVWRNRPYAVFEAGLTPQSITSWMQRVGVTWLAWELTHSNVWVGAVAAADLAPMLVLAPFAGAMVDRSPNPMRVLVFTNVLMLVQAVLLAVLTYWGTMTIELLFALSLVTGIIHPYASAARQIVLAGSVPRSDFAPAIALDSALFQASRFIGPAIAAVMIAAWDVLATFIAHIAGCAILIAALFAVKVVLPENRNRLRGNLLIDVADSLRYARGNAAIWPLFVLLAVCSILLRPVQDLLPGFASRVFEAGPEGLGWLASAMGAGAMTSATLIAVRGKVEGLSTWAIAGGLILVLATLGMCSTNDLRLGILFACLSAFGLNTMSTSIQTITQSVVSDGMRGRVMSLYTLIFRGTPAIGALALGAAADRMGLPQVFATVAVMTACVWALVALRWRSIARAVREEMG